MAVEITGSTTTPLSGKKTDDSKIAPGNTVELRSQSTGGSVEAVNNIAASPVDKLTLTPQVDELRMIEKAINEQPDFDNERVESLKFEIDAGRYDIDATRVAEKFIEFELLFVA